MDHNAILLFKIKILTKWLPKSKQALYSFITTLVNYLPQSILTSYFFFFPFLLLFLFFGCMVCRIDHTDEYSSEAQQKGTPPSVFLLVPWQREEATRSWHSENETQSRHRCTMVGGPYAAAFSTKPELLIRQKRWRVQRLERRKLSAVVNGRSVN